MHESYYATPLTTPVFDVIEVGDKNLGGASNRLERRLSIDNLAKLLSAKGKRDRFPGWIQSGTTLRKRVVMINKAIPDFQRQQYKPLSPYQIWVIVRIHEDFLRVTPADWMEVALTIRDHKQNYSLEKYKYEQNRTEKENQTHRNRVCKLVESA